MHLLRKVTACTPVLLLALLAGCNTDDELAQQRLNVLKAQVDSLQSLKKDLTDNPLFEAPGTVSIFLSKGLINSALAGASGITMRIPNVSDATITIKSIQADFKLGYPLITVDAEATKKDLGLTVQVVGTARLETHVDAGASQLIADVRLEDLVPRAQWGVLDFKINGFVKDLIKAKASNELNTIATFKIPIATDMPLALPARSMPVNLPGVVAAVATPALALKAHANVTRVVVLPDGVHVYGTVNSKVGA